MRTLPRTLAAAFGVAAALLPNAAAAHASLISSQPSPNATYATSPGVVVLVFSEPLNVALSWGGVTTPAGRRARATVVQQRQMQVPVPDTAPGVYQVEWTTVSALDGHVLSGGYEFGVRVRVPGTETEAGSALPISDLVLAALRWIEYLGLLLAVGVLVLGVLAGRSPALPWAARSPVVPLAVALASGVAVIAVETANAADALTPAAAWTYLLAGTAGPARLARLLAEALAIAVAVRRPGLAALPVAAAVTALAASGHSAALPAWPAPIVLDALHLAAAGVWAGAILAMAALRPPGGWLSGAGRTLLQRFAPVALAAFPVTLLTGVVQAVLDVGDPQRLLSTAYGNTLLVKVLLVAAMLPLSLLAWRRTRARPRLEAGIAALVVAASSLLASYPATPARLGAGETALQAASSQSLPLDGALSLASPRRRDAGCAHCPARKSRPELRIPGPAAGRRACRRGASAPVALDRRPCDRRRPLRRELLGGEHRPLRRRAHGGPSSGRVRGGVLPSPGAAGR